MNNLSDMMVADYNGRKNINQQNHSFGMRAVQVSTRKVAILLPTQKLKCACDKGNSASIIAKVDQPGHLSGHVEHRCSDTAKRENNLDHCHIATKAIRSKNMHHVKKQLEKQERRRW